MQSILYAPIHLECALCLLSRKSPVPVVRILRRCVLPHHFPAGFLFLWWYPKRRDRMVEFVRKIFINILRFADIGAIIHTNVLSTKLPRIQKRNESNQCRRTPATIFRHCFHFLFITWIICSATASDKGGWEWQHVDADIRRLFAGIVP